VPPLEDCVESSDATGISLRTLLPDLRFLSAAVVVMRCLRRSAALFTASAHAAMHDLAERRLYTTLTAYTTVESLVAGAPVSSSTLIEHPLVTVIESNSMVWDSKVCGGRFPP
jgi:hypothetical protein